MHNVGLRHNVFILEAQHAIEFVYESIVDTMLVDSFI